MSQIEKAYKRLKMLRKAAGYKLAIDFCNEFNIPISTYGMHETGRRKIMPEVAEKYAKLLNANPSWLILGIGEPKNTPTEIEEKLNEKKEFLKLLNYSGNQKILATSKKKNFNASRLEHVDPLLFTKIIIALLETLKEFNMACDAKLISNQAVEIYLDIIQASNSLQEQLTMINLAITVFKRNLKEQNNNNTTESN